MIQKANPEEVRRALDIDTHLDHELREMVRRLYGIDRNEQTIEQIAETYRWKPEQVVRVITRFHERHGLVTAQPAAKRTW